jgi:hypothetical protein
MNLLLHGIGGDSDAPVPILVKDALGAKHGEYEMVLTNPPFGKKSSVTIVNEVGDEEKQSLPLNLVPEARTSKGPERAMDGLGHGSPPPIGRSCGRARNGETC